MVMKAQYKTKSGRLVFECTGEFKELFKQIAKVQEIYEAADVCGSCGSDNLAYVHRVVNGNDYYELRCRAMIAADARLPARVCGYSMKFGQNKVGGLLFPKPGWSKHTYDEEVSE